VIDKILPMQTAPVETQSLLPKGAPPPDAGEGDFLQQLLATVGKMPAVEAQDQKSVKENSKGELEKQQTEASAKKSEEKNLAAFLNEKLAAPAVNTKQKSKEEAVVAVGEKKTPKVESVPVPVVAKNKKSSSVDAKETVDNSINAVLQNRNAVRDEAALNSYLGSDVRAVLQSKNKLEDKKPEIKIDQKLITKEDVNLQNSLLAFEPAVQKVNTKEDKKSSNVKDLDLVGLNHPVKELSYELDGPVVAEKSVVQQKHVPMSTLDLLGMRLAKEEQPLVSGKHEFSPADYGIMNLTSKNVIDAKDQLAHIAAGLKIASGPTDVKMPESVNLKNNWELQSVVHGLAKQGGGQVKMKVLPEGLGELTITVTQRPLGLGKKELDLKFEASTKEAQNLLTDNISSLRQELSSKNIDVASIDIKTESKNSSQDVVFVAAMQSDEPKVAVSSADFMKNFDGFDRNQERNNHERYQEQYERFMSNQDQRRQKQQNQFAEMFN